MFAEIFTLTVPMWLVLVLVAVTATAFFVLGVVRCYAKTKRIGDLIFVDDPENGERYMFMELNKPMDELRADISDGTEVLSTIRVKNRP